jgi:hypothetical protein
MVGVKLTKVHCGHIWKCHNENPPVKLIYANKNVKFKKKQLTCLPREMRVLFALAAKGSHPLLG